MSTTTEIPAPPAAETKLATVRVLLLYRGAWPHEDESGGIDYEYAQIDGEPESPDTWKLAKREPRIFTKNLCKHAMPGTVFSIAVPVDDAGNKVLVNTSKFVGLWPEQKERLEWAAASRAREHASRDAIALRKLCTTHPLPELLAPLRAAYASTNAEARRQLLAEVVRIITGGRP